VPTIAFQEAEPRDTIREMSLAHRALFLAALSASTACYTPQDEARDRFSRNQSCPKNAIGLRTRPDVDA
jgi:hypothetical protein